MKKTHTRLVDNNNYAHDLNGRGTGSARKLRAWRRTLLKNFAGMDFTLAAVVIGTMVLAFSVVGTSTAVAQSPGPPFANPSQIRPRAGEKRLRGIMEMINGDLSVPGLMNDQYRQFRGRDAAERPPGLGTSVSPGPTLRARLGYQVQIAFLNKVKRENFPFTFVQPKDNPPLTNLGCDKVFDSKTGTFPYPLRDKYPNCFHGSNTANIHFHGTHTNPDGLGDNVLVQVLNDPGQQDWTATFNQMYDSRRIPQKWIELPEAFRRAQLNLVRKYDADAKADAIKNDETIPEPMEKKNRELIAAGQWPQYFIGAFPNFFAIPDYDKATGAFNSGGNGFRAGQAPGTHWYHAHKHGSTSLHIRNGLAGAFIIESSHEGGYDHFIRKFYDWGDTYDDNEEKIFVVQQYDPEQNLERRQQPPPPARGPGSRQNLVNGQLRPTITMRPGEVQLWRFVNATEGNNAGIIQPTVFQTAGFTFKQTAKDGVQFSPDNYKNQPFLNATAPNGMVPGGLTLAAANRADLLVQAPATASATPIPFKSGAATLFYVNVTGTPVRLPNGAFPTTWAEMPKFLLDLRKPGPRDSPNPDSPVKFQWEKPRSATGLNADGFPPHFMINDKQFEEKGPHVDQCMPQDGLQEWVLENYTSGVAHPFHIHINPFQVVRIETPTDLNTSSTYAPMDNFVWQDVIAIPAAKISEDGTKINPGRVVIRQAYPDFHGTFVLHCHILAHEDRGMMQLVRIVPSALYRRGCQGHIPDHH